MRLAWLLLVLCAASVSASAFTSLMDVLSSSFKYAYVPEYHAFSSHSIFLINTSHLMQMDGSHLRHNRRDSHCDVRAGRYRLSAHVASDVQYSGGASQSYSAGGTIPAEISLLGATLTTLRISGYPGLNAGLIGGIPSQLSFLSGLKTLSFGNNRLNGTIPAELGYLTEIAILDLSDNQLTGAVPGSLTALSALLQVDLSGNFLGGPLSAALALFTATVSIRLDNNAFTGPIPTQLPSASTLLTLEISTNPLSGGLPTQLLGTLTALKELYASACGLSGVIPTEILITGINILDLSNNTFTSFPPELLSRTMSTLNLNNNQFSGPLPTQVGSPGATSLSLAGNFFTGPIPPFKSSKQIKIDLSNNPLATTLPDWSNFTTTVIGSELRLRNCGLVGPLPPFSPYTKWAVIDLAFNSLYGSLAPFSALTGANTIDVENNYLTGTFPSALANNLNLIQLNVGSNLLSGTVPSSFAAFPLSSLILRDNNFTGPYPTTFSSSILLLVGVADFTLNDFDNCSKASPSPLILLSCRAVPIGTPPPPLPPTTAPAATTPAATTPAATTPAVTTVPAATTLAPTTLPVTTAPGCQLPPPFDLAECIGGVWIVNDTSGGVGAIVVGGTPVVVVGDLVLTNSSVVLVTPGGVLNITGTIVLGGVIVIAFPASQPPQDGEFVPVLNAGNVTGAVVRVELQYTRDCGDATGTPQTTETSFGVLISVKGCGHRRTAIIAGSVIGGVILLTALIVAAFLVARKMGWGRTLFQQREARNQSYLY